MTLALPPLGFGCSPLAGGRPGELVAAVRAALALGYRRFETAEAHGTETLLGDVLAAGGVRDAFVVTKLEALLVPRDDGGGKAAVGLCC